MVIVIGICRFPSHVLRLMNTFRFSLSLVHVSGLIKVRWLRIDLVMRLCSFAKQISFVSFVCIP